MGKIKYSFVFLIIVSLISMNFAFAGDTNSTSTSDIKPNKFNFTDRSNCEINKTIISNRVRISWINSESPITVSGWTISINSEADTSGKVSNWDYVTIRVACPSTYSTKSIISVDIGWIKDTFSITSKKDPTDKVPNKFSITPKIWLERDTEYVSNAKLINWFNSDVSVTASGGLMKIFSYTKNAKWRLTFSWETEWITKWTLSPNSKIIVKAKSSVNYGTISEVVITAWWVSGSFKIKTKKWPIQEDSVTTVQ